MGADTENGCVKEYLIENPTIELNAMSLYDLAASLLESNRASAKIFISWLTSMITSETGKIDPNAGVSVLMHLAGIFSANNDLFEYLARQISSGGWIKKLTEEQRSALFRYMLDHYQPVAAPIPNSVGRHKLSIFFSEIPNWPGEKKRKVHRDS